MRPTKVLVLIFLTFGLTNSTSSDRVPRGKNELDNQDVNTTLPTPIDDFRFRRRRTADFDQNEIKRRRVTKDSSQEDNFILHPPFNSNPNSSYIRLLVVHDYSQFKEYNGNKGYIIERTVKMVNIMNAYYRQLNIFIALAGVVIWSEKDEITLTEDGDATLTNFLEYRYKKLLPRYEHDNAQLITSTSFNGSVVGKALKGTICTYEHSGGVNTDHSYNPAIVAATLSHELGHNLGMEHDEEDKCNCPDEKCIMSSSSSTVHPKTWSSCSINYLQESRRQGLLDCLSKTPKTTYGPTCGNGFVEEGEDCDLGEPVPTPSTSKNRFGASKKCNSNDLECQRRNLTPNNPCCDRLKCKFVANATCAQGTCCDLTKCSIYNSDEPKVCRPKRGACDLEEYCDGESEYCPLDAHYHDGIPCKLKLSETQASTLSHDAYCFDGRCSNHHSQCQLLWGSTGYSSKEICYAQNVHGNTSGSCGYDRQMKFYHSCEQQDTSCGMLHCVHNQPDNDSSTRKTTGKLNYGFESASILTTSSFVMSNHAIIYCHGSIIDSGPDMQDPGLVPNGAICGENRMCLNQKCVPLEEVTSRDSCPSNCNDNGICDNMGICHCYDGTIGTSCFRIFGTSLTSIIYLIIFLGSTIAIYILATNRYDSQNKFLRFLRSLWSSMVFLRAKGRLESNSHQTGRPTGAAANHRINISAPIPLKQSHNNKYQHQPYRNSLTDPWLETSYSDGVKSPGYRLDPIPKDDKPVV